MVTPGSTIGPYRIDRQLGQGGMATVYLAFDERLDREVAIKVIPEYSNADPTLRERFRREARAAARLRHPHIVTVYNFLESGSVNGIVMEYVPGGTLRERMGKRFPVQEVTSILGPIADAIDYAHNLGLIHRDIKPANIMIAQDGRPVLTDFGLVRIADQDSGLTATAVTAGTPEYIAPEQALGLQVTGAVDVYSLTLIAYEMICGAQPYVADTPIALLVAHAHQDPRPPHDVYPGIPVKLEEALLKGLSRDPLQRFSNARGLITALANGISEPTILVSQVSAPPIGEASTSDTAQPVYCSQCGARNERQARFCAQCGNSLSPSQPQAEKPPVAPPPPAVWSSPQASVPTTPWSPPPPPTPPVSWSPPPPPPHAFNSQAAPLLYAGVLERFGAVLIDGIVMSVAWVVIIGLLAAAFGETGDSSEEISTLLGFIVIIILFGLPWLYSALQESSSRQATLGQRVVGLIVTDAIGQRISFGRASGRHFGKYVSSMTLGIGYLIAIFNTKRQTLHDIMASTLVIKGKR